MSDVRIVARQAGQVLPSFSRRSRFDAPPSVPKEYAVLYPGGACVWPDGPYGWSWIDLVWRLPPPAGPLWDIGGVESGDAL